MDRSCFYGLRYHIHINTPEEDITFHDQIGYWLWEPATGLILQSVTIPRGQVLLASGHAKPDDRKISVTAKRGEMRCGICSTDFWKKLSAPIATGTTSPSMTTEAGPISSRPSLWRREEIFHSIITTPTL